MSETCLLSIVVPTYNEGESIGACLRALEVWRKKVQFSTEVVVVDSGSTDNTLSILHRKIQKDPGLILIDQKQRLGMGVAFQEAWEMAKGKYICHFDSDQPYELDYLQKAIEVLENENCELVLGVRYGDRANLARILYSLGYRFFLTLLFGSQAHFESINYTFKVFRSSLLGIIDIRSKKWFVDAELVLETLRVGGKIVELPVPYLVRAQGSSTIRFKDVIEIAQEALEYRRR